MAEVKLRPCVRRFAELMELKLRENDHKGGWEGEGWAWLMERLREEVDELEEARKKGLRFYGPRVIGEEAADVASFAMMIADNAGALNED